jgi:cation/acetate symporter
VISGLLLAGAATIGHDLYAAVFANGNASERSEVFVARIANIALGSIAVLLSLAFEEQNVAFLIGLAFSIAASCNFPVLAMSILWRGMTTKGAVIGGFLGLLSSIAGIVFSPVVWVAVLGHPEGSAPFPHDNPTLFSMPLAFIGIWLVSKLDFSARAAKDKIGFDAQFVRSQTGISASHPVAY